MYIVTFYSFKGGTGRSMALLNVAADLLSRNRRVLLVDFDLEAPGLDTFPMRLNRPVNRGLVEMITDYLRSFSESTPAVQDYVYGATLEGVASGSLWIMPAGSQDSSYDSRFRSIDWQDFYQNQGGFLFFEDLKLQWKQVFEPDYILIDSRTGHTDIGGICTRQLPDCVVAMFYPNGQNLRGLAPVVEDIRDEEAGPLKKRIDIHFVMGNVPDLDDEEEILSNTSKVFEQTLGYEELSATIHHFSSLSMLKQRLMLVDRPRSRIAVEYRQLASAIIRQNLEDREGALSVLNELLVDLRRDSDAIGDSQLEKKLELIRTNHSQDTEVMRRLARFRRVQRRTDDALDLFEHVLHLDKRDPESLVGRAELLAIAGRAGAASNDLMTFFGLEQVPSFSFELAARLSITNERFQLPNLLKSPAIPALPANTVSDVLQDLQRSFRTCDTGASFAQIWLAANPDNSEYAWISHELSLCLIAAGRFDEAIREICKAGRFETLGLADAFNYAIAQWGVSDQVNSELFERMLPKIEDAIGDTRVNHLQCFSLAYWAMGNSPRALELLENAVSRFAAAPRRILSCWNYLYRSPREFRSDLEAMNLLYRTGEGKPGFIRTNADAAFKQLAPRRSVDFKM